MSLSKLPDELLLMICEKLFKVRDLVAFSCCSKRLNLICRDVNYVNDVYHIDKNEQVEKVYGLDLSNCENIVDVSKLNIVHTLNLSHCVGITDASKLNNVHTLNLSGCKNVTDVSMLGNVHTLNLSYCVNITDISKLGNVHNLDTHGCF